MVLPATPPRFGLSFGPTTIIASRFNDTGVLENFKFPASDDYQSYFRDAILRYDNSSKYTSSKPGSDTVVATTLHSIYSSLTRQIGHTPDISSVWVSPVLGDDFRHAVSSTTFKNARYITKTGFPVEAACGAYDFLDGKNLNRTAKECTEYGPDSAVLMLNYEHDCLDVWLVDVAFDVPVYGHGVSKLSTNYGEKHRKEDGYQELVAAFLTPFVDDQVSPFKKRQYEPHYKREDIRAIVVFGEASTEAVDGLGSIARDVVGTDEVNVLTEFEAAEVVARGAAAFSSWTQANPDMFWCSHCGAYDDEYYAQEDERKKMKEAESKALQIKETQVACLIIGIICTSKL